jgi:hypothetical protein
VWRVELKEGDLITFQPSEENKLQDEHTRFCIYVSTPPLLLSETNVADLFSDLACWVLCPVMSDTMLHDQELLVLHSERVLVALSLN